MSLSSNVVLRQSSSRFFIDMKEDPEYGAYITEGSLGILATDKSLRGNFYEGKGPVASRSASAAS